MMLSPSASADRHRTRSLIAATALILLLAACAARVVPPRPEAAGPLFPNPATYVLQIGDRLNVKFYRNPELNEEVVVRPDGKISLEYVQDLPAAGLTPDALATEIQRGYENELLDPQVTVLVRNLGGHRYYVGGEVARQGVYQLAGGLTIFQAIQEAGGFTTTANRKQVVLIRREADGRAVGRAIDLRPVQSGEALETDVPLQPYDAIFVPRSRVANVNVFIEKYIRNNLPVNPGIGLGGF